MSTETTYNEERTGANKPEPPPIKSEYSAAWDLVMQDIRERDQAGEKKYGVRLQPMNGRDALTDLYQELLDATVYIRSRIEEEKIIRRLIFDVLQIVTAAEQIPDKRPGSYTLIKHKLEQALGIPNG